MTSAICDNMHKPTGYYAKWNVSNRERQTSHDFTYIWSLEKTNKQIKPNTDSETDQTNACQRKEGWKDAWKGEGNTVCTIVIGLQGDRRLLDLVWWSHCKACKCWSTILYTLHEYISTY